LERSESFAGAAGERDDLLLLVEVECLPVGGGGFVAPACCFEYPGEVTVSVGLNSRRVCLLDVY
jgi:hypothetical protein